MTRTVRKNLTVPDPGVPVVSSGRGSPAWRAGVRRGDLILAIDGRAPLDSIDADILTAEAEFTLTIRRARRRFTLRVARREGIAHGMVFAPPPIRTCVNDCPFCYVDQFPANDRIAKASRTPGMASERPTTHFRDGLGIYDDDYRHSFLFGNYVTLTNLARADLARIIALRLSPLYVSVHATDPEVRARLLGRPRVAVMPVLERLAENGLAFHAQIVLIRGVNDGGVLRKSLSELAGLRPAIRTIAIVPVGLTAHHHRGVPAWTASEARQILPSLKRLADRHPPGLVQLADEWFTRAGVEPPPAEHYGDFEVIEDGVGLIRRLIDDWKKVKLPARTRSTRGLVITGRSPARFIRRIVARLNRIHGVTLDLGICDNLTFGAPVTVTGLLAWRDILPVIVKSEARTVYLPDVLLDRRKRFLDDVTLREAERVSGRRLRVIETSAKGFASIIDSSSIGNSHESR